MLQLLVALTVLLSASLLLEKFFERLHQPVILGQLLAGIVLGPSLLGKLSPITYDWMFKSSDIWNGFLPGFNTLAGIFLLLFAGLKVGMPNWDGLGKPTLAVSVGGMVLPALLGCIAVFFGDTWGLPARYQDSWAFMAFFALALSISALPVIAKTLMELHLLRTKIGSITMASASVNDVLGWVLFSVVLAAAKGNEVSYIDVLQTLSFTLIFAVVMVRLVPIVFNRLSRQDTGHDTVHLYPIIISTLLAAAVTDWIGVHAFFGAFFAGVAWSRVHGTSDIAFKRTKDIVFSFFAPIFFASLGLKADFTSNFDFSIVAMTLALACAGKIIGCGLAALATGVNYRKAWSIGFCMNARGAMEMIFGAIAYETGLIGAEIYVALMAMAFITSAMAGPAITTILMINRPVKEVVVRNRVVG